ncbi:DeoR/GlpR family DNA-binding transcription regulator [Paenibacillus sp. MBLB4367]|uniref:DeoR/GlpR family DNA-binding transcription regulator n=1 Tax=Paenibacillus sp. MBLB4367 TaxID=3384767 RepID=UPI0039083411
MFAQERHKAIVRKLQREQSVKASELVELFEVSTETIRRDLEHLECEGLLKRVHGGAVAAEPGLGEEIPYAEREIEQLEEKNELAEIAVTYVSEDDSIALDASTTNERFAKALKSRVERLTVVTNSLRILNELIDMPHYRIILAGGLVRSDERSIVGDMAEAFISQFHVDTFFMSMGGVSLAKGITSYGIGEVSLQKAMHRNAQKTIALGASSKFDTVSLLKVCDCAEVECFVTDSKINKDIVRAYGEHGIEIVHP